MQDAFEVLPDAACRTPGRASAVASESASATLTQDAPGRSDDAENATPAGAASRARCAAARAADDIALVTLEDAPEQRLPPVSPLAVAEAPDDALTRRGGLSAARRLDFGSGSPPPELEPTAATFNAIPASLALSPTRATRGGDGMGAVVR